VEGGRLLMGDGGWCYNYKAEEHGGVKKMTMTTAGLATLFITKEFTNAMDGIGCTPVPRDEHMERGMQWVSKNFEKYKEYYPLYALYNVERVGVASGYKYFGNVNWFEVGAEDLVKRQRGDGS